MGRFSALVRYKLRFFFGPAFRGRLGPLVFVALLLVFLPQGFFLGFGLGTAIREGDPSQAIDLLTAPLAGLMSFAFLWALGTGVTAHASEFDFLLTADVRPREYLAADLAFQIASLVLTGGLAIGLAAVGLALGAGGTLAMALPLLAIFVAYVVLVLLLVQVFIVLRVRHPRMPVRLLLILLLLLSLLPAVSLARPDVPLRLGEAPLPPTAFASLGLAVLRGTAWPVADILVAAAYAAGIGAAWYALSGAYIFHGIRPALSAGLGQVSVAAKIDQQRRIIGGLGPLTTRIRLRTERGTETGLMIRLHLIRILRDGSILFIVLLAIVWIGPAAFGADGFLRGGQGVVVTQLVALAIAILAMNWSYYERETLWIVQIAQRSPASYFRGMLLGLATIGLAMTAASYGVLAAASGALPRIGDIALPIAASFGAAFGATAFLTRLKIPPAAFSPAMLLILFLVIIAAFMGGLAAQGLVILSDLLLGVGAAAQAFALAAFLLAFVAFALWTVARLSLAFRL